MDSDFDLVIRNGTVFDGTGAAGSRADVGIRGGLIAAVGEGMPPCAEEIDATGRIVTPGFVDIHTHFDGQVTWENRLAPASQHGVTTVVMGNCGVGFAPARAHQRDMMIQLMEGVEDIPGVVMAEGLPWNWETFPNYLDALDQREADVDFAAQLPHSPLRVYVMGERGAAGEPPTAEDLATMRRLVAEGMEAGALGVTTSRTHNHRFRDGRPAPSTLTDGDELRALALGLRDAGKGVFQMVPSTEREPADEFALMRSLAELSGRPLSFSMTQSPGRDWQAFLRGLEGARRDGLAMRTQIIPRPIGILFGLDLSFHTFALNPSYAAIADLPLAEKVARMRQPDVRAALLRERPQDSNAFFVWLVEQADRQFVLGDPPDYCPDPANSLAAIAAREGRDVREVIYDTLLADEGRTIIYAPMGNSLDGRMDSARSFLKRPDTLVALGDGGAHYGMICDASLPTWLLTAAVRDAAPGAGIDLPRAIHLLTRNNAEAVGLNDRGLIAPGYKADVNVIDYEHLALHAPQVRRDLPAGGRRIVQQAAGYDATIVAGVVTYRNGVHSGALPGRLVRGAR